MASRNEFSDTSSESELDLDFEEPSKPSIIHAGFGVRQAWEQVYVLICTTGLFIDPLFFYPLSISESWMCMFIDGWFAVTVTVVRCMTDVLHLVNMWLQFEWNRWSRYDMKLRKKSCNVANDKGLRVAVRRVLFDLFVILPIPQVY